VIMMAMDPRPKPRADIGRPVQYKSHHSVWLKCSSGSRPGYVSRFARMEVETPPCKALEDS
jgi:hypothetical protein